ncbi:DUF4176 domain-containing protein [Listeria booriae]|nr:DUF4176 domain-containing protein [Listeria booriae]
MSTSKPYLPLGSVILLKNGQKELMIYGRKQKDVKSNKIFDYAACLYPEGHISKDHIIVFNHESIDQILFMGFNNEMNKLYVKRALLKDEEFRLNL